jgi:AcrR family transcriptional regulator
MTEDSAPTPVQYFGRAADARRRAPAMSTEERRAAIVQATLPLLAEHGMKVTTKQIAAAAGIAEGTVFRVFTDKQELISACVQEVMQQDQGLAAIRAVPRDLPLAERLSRVGHGMADRMRRIGALMHSLVATGYKPGRLDDGKPPPDRGKWIRDALDALVDLIGPDADTLRLPPRRSAQVFLALVFSTQFAGRLGQSEAETDQIEIDELIDVFMHGVLKKSQGDV